MPGSRLTDTAINFSRAVINFLISYFTDFDQSSRKPHIPRKKTSPPQGDNTQKYIILDSYLPKSFGYCCILYDHNLYLLSVIITTCVCVGGWSLLRQNYAMWNYEEWTYLLLFIVGIAVRLTKFTDRDWFCLYDLHHWTRYSWNENKVSYRKIKTECYLWM